MKKIHPRVAALLVLTYMMMPGFMAYLFMLEECLLGTFAYGALFTPATIMCLIVLISPSKNNVNCLAFCFGALPGFLGWVIFPMSLEFVASLAQ
jgi:hypothetical protein